jgi:hypothetical protein
MSDKSQSQKMADLPVVEEWVTAAEAASIAGVTRQYLHNSARTFESAHRLSGFLVFRRSEMVEFGLARAQKRQQRAAAQEKPKAQAAAV